MFRLDLVAHSVQRFKQLAFALDVDKTTTADMLKVSMSSTVLAVALQLPEAAGAQLQRAVAQDYFHLLAAVRFHSCQSSGSSTPGCRAAGI